MAENQNETGTLSNLGKKVRYSAIEMEDKMVWYVMVMDCGRSERRFRGDETRVRCGGHQFGEEKRG